MRQIWRVVPKVMHPILANYFGLRRQRRGLAVFSQRLKLPANNPCIYYLVTDIKSCKMVSKMKEEFRN